MTGTHPAIGLLMIAMGVLVTVALLSAFDGHLFRAGTRPWFLLATRATGMSTGGAIAIYAHMKAQRRLAYLSLGLFFAFLGCGQDPWFFLVTSFSAVSSVGTGVQTPRP